LRLCLVVQVEINVVVQVDCLPRFGVVRHREREFLALARLLLCIVVCH
jgi:hypothetical protein